MLRLYLELRQWPLEELHRPQTVIGPIGQMLFSGGMIADPTEGTSDPTVNFH